MAKTFHCAPRTFTDLKVTSPRGGSANFCLGIKTKPPKIPLGFDVVFKKNYKNIFKKEGSAKLLGLSFMRMLATCVCSLKESDGGRCGSGRSTLKCSWNSCILQLCITQTYSWDRLPKSSGRRSVRGHHCSGQFGITPKSKWNRAEVFICQETTLTDLESSLGLVVGFIDV